MQAVARCTLPAQPPCALMRGAHVLPIALDGPGARARTFDSRGMIACSVSPGVAISTVSPAVVLPRMIASTAPRGQVVSLDSRSLMSVLLYFVCGGGGGGVGRGARSCARRKQRSSTTHTLSRRLRSPIRPPPNRLRSAPQAANCYRGWC